MEDKSKIDVWVKTHEKTRLKDLSKKEDKSVTTLIKEAIKLLLEKYEKDLQ